jgi:hypothetical protein
VKVLRLFRYDAASEDEGPRQPLLDCFVSDKYLAKAFLSKAVLEEMPDNWHSRMNVTRERIPRASYHSLSTICLW